LTEKYGEVTPEVLEAQSELYGLVSKYASDVILTSGVDAVVRKLARVSDQPSVYAYQFNWGAAQAPGEGVIPDPLGYLVGACHGMEIDFFFGLAGEEDRLWSGMFTNTYTDEYRAGRVALGNAITSYISAFVRTGNPNPSNSNLLQWQPWQIGLQKLPKKIIFDADLDAATIEMSTEAKTVMSVMRQLQAEPRYEDIQEFMGSFLEAFGG
jgi:para-nitrobenzyl esterase